MRVIQDATRDGAAALNYGRVEGLIKTRKRATGYRRDLATEPGASIEYKRPVWWSATEPGRTHAPRWRSVRGCEFPRGSHIFLPQSKLPLTRAVTSPTLPTVVRFHPALAGRDAGGHHGCGSQVGTLHRSTYKSESDDLMQAVSLRLPGPGLEHGRCPVQPGGSAGSGGGRAKPTLRRSVFVLWKGSGPRPPSAAANLPLSA